MRPAEGSRRSFRPASGVARAPRSKPELAKLPTEELRELAAAVGQSNTGTRPELIRRIEERGVAYVADKDKAPELDPDANVDPDAVAIADSTLATLPANHPGWNGPQISKEDVRDPAQTDEAPTADHRPPEAREGGPTFADAGEARDALGSQLEHDMAPMRESEVHGQPLEDVDAEAADAVAPEDDDEEEKPAKGKGK